MPTQMIDLKDDRYALLPQEEYQDLMAQAAGIALPRLPALNERGNYPGLELVGVLIARGLIVDRLEAGLTQEDVAERAGVPLDVVQDVERGGEATGDERAIDAIDAVLTSARQGRG